VASGLAQTHPKTQQRKTSIGCLHQKNDCEDSQIGQSGTIDFGKPFIDTRLCFRYTNTVNNKKVKIMFTYKNIAIATVVVLAIVIGYYLLKPKKVEVTPAKPAITQQAAPAKTAEPAKATPAKPAEPAKK
jgi:hypothetical protein